MRQAVILCGGRGERLRPLTDDRPKALVHVGGRSFLDHILSQLKREGCDRVVLLSGYKADQIVSHVGSSWHGMHIDHSVGPESWSTGRRILEAQSLLADEFLLLYADNYAHLEWTTLDDIRRVNGATVVLSVDRKSPGNVRLERSTFATYSAKRQSTDFEHVEVGYMLCVKNGLVAALCAQSDREDALPRALQTLSENSRVCAIRIRGGYLSISSPDRRDATERFLTPKRILLIDRDGTINERAPRGQYVSSLDGFVWREDAKNAVRVLAQRGFTFVVITNQAGVATGDVDPAELIRIHEKMTLDFRSLGAELLGILCNTEHWSTASEMRKPGPGMILEAAETWQFHPERVMYVGDDLRDAQAAYNAGSVGVLIGNHADDDVPPGTLQVASLTDAVGLIEKRYQEVSTW
ncbi:MAG: HAD-IIIA family hydrolase [Ilumatobacteraceae bacterium]